MSEKNEKSEKNELKALVPIDSPQNLVDEPEIGPEELVLEVDLWST